LSARPLRRSAVALLALAVNLAIAPASAPASPLSREAELLGEYLRFDTGNPPGAERPAIDWLAGELRAAGLAPQILTSPRGRSSLAVRLAATVADAPVVVLLHHVDVVPAGDGWKQPPFSGAMQDGAIWGRGAIDTKGLGIAHLAALLDAAKAPVRSRELLFLATADEEAGGIEGVGWLIEQRTDLFDRVEAVLNEGGGVKSVAGRVLYWGVEVDQKRPLWLRVRARGRGGHASNADSKSAAHRLLAGLAEIVREPPSVAVSRSALDFFSRLGRIDPRALQVHAAATRLDAGVALSATEKAALAGYDNLLRDSLQVTTLAAGERVNVVAAEASAEIDVRLLPETDAVAFVARLKERIGPDLEVETILPAPAAAPPSPTTHPVYRTIEAELAREAPVVATFIPSFTDSRYFRARGIAAYGFSPFPIDAVELLTVHARDERISIAAFDRGVATMRRVVRALLGIAP
jgi:acetylornithine deacetylase/succinyl-diaminopimelate desuccinylase-like protein